MDTTWTSNPWMLALAFFSCLFLVSLVMLVVAARRTPQELGPSFHVAFLGVIVTVILGLVAIILDGESTSPIRQELAAATDSTAPGTTPNSPAASTNPATAEPTPTTAVDVATSGPNPTAEPENSGWEVLLTADFDDQSEIEPWTEHSDPARRFSVVDGEFVIEKLDEESSAPYVVVSKTYQDAVITVDARLTGPLDLRYVFVTCRGMYSTDQVRVDTGYRFTLDPTRQIFMLSLWNDGEVTTLRSGERRDAIVSDDGSNRIQLSCIGNEITAWVNGEEVARVTNETLQQGRSAIGIGTYTGETGTAEVRFDNLEVKAPAAPY